MSFPALKTSDASQDNWNRNAASVVNAHSKAFRASGTTALRPTANLYVGQFYYDTTLDRPIWWNGAAWKRADGVSV